MPRQKRGVGRGVQKPFATLTQTAGSCAGERGKKRAESGQDESKHRTEALPGKTDGEREKESLLVKEKRRMILQGRKGQ